jgi:hypothetical protein
MGHDSARAAMIYQYAAAEADQKIADTLDQRMGRLATMPATKSNGTQGLDHDHYLVFSQVELGVPEFRT